MAEKPLTPKQKRFVDEYLIDLNATQAYKRAGYSAKTDVIAASEGFKLLRKPKIAAAIEVGQKKKLNGPKLIKIMSSKDSRKLQTGDYKTIPGTHKGFVKL